MAEPAQKQFRFCPLCGFKLCKRRIDSRKRLVCRKCGWIHYANPLPVAVCAAMDKKRRILAVKRNLKPGINKWSLPGGFVERSESPETACLRELKEETGLKGKTKSLIGAYIHRTKEYGSLIVIGYEVEVSQGLLALSNEVKDAKFFSKRDLPVIPFLSHRKIIEEVFKHK